MKATLSWSGTGLHLDGALPSVLGVITEQEPTGFTLTKVLPAVQTVYYRIGEQLLEIADRFADLEPVKTQPSAGILTALIHGVPLAPDETHVPQVRRLALGTSLRFDPSGVTVTAAAAPAPTSSGADISAAARQVLSTSTPMLGIGHAGGLASTFLLHHTPGAAALEAPSDMDSYQVTGAELIPPLPDAYLPVHALSRIAKQQHIQAVSGAVLEDLFSGKLSDAAEGTGGWLLRGCEPFHTNGILHGLAAARKALHDDQHPGLDEHDSDTAAPSDASVLPGLTEPAHLALEGRRTASGAVWQEHRVAAGRILGIIEDGLDARKLTWLGEEAGARELLLPALSEPVIQAAESYEPADLVKIRDGKLINALPLTITGQTGCAQSGHAFRCRLAAAHYLHRHRHQLIPELTRATALADLGIADPGRMAAALTDGTILTAHALRLLRAIWLQRWLEGGGNT